MKNFGLFMISAAISVMLFMFVLSQRNSIQRVLVVPLEFQNLPRDKVILLPTLRQIQVTIQGPAFMVAEAAAGARSAKVVLPQNIPDRYDVSFDGSELGLPPAINVVRIEPSSMQLILDRRIRREVPVIVPRIGKCQDHLKLESFVVAPPRVTINGPETEVKSITHVETAPLDLRNLEGQTSHRLPIRETWQYTRSETPAVDVDVHLQSILKEREFAEVPIEVRSRAPRPVLLDPPAVKLTVSGMASTIDKLKPEDIDAYIKLRDGQMPSAPVRAELPQGVSLVGVQPARVRLIYPPETAAAEAAQTPEGEVNGTEKQGAKVLRNGRN